MTHQTGPKRSRPETTQAKMTQAKTTRPKRPRAEPQGRNDSGPKQPVTRNSRPGWSCVAGALSWGAFLRFVQSMQRFVPIALFKMAATFNILSVLLGRNGYWLKWFWAENVQMTSDAFIFNYAPVLARVLTQNRRLKNKDAIFVCLNKKFPRMETALCHFKGSMSRTATPFNYSSTIIN